jgi:general secretion pathway protein G
MKHERSSGQRPLRVLLAASAALLCLFVAVLVLVPLLVPRHDTTGFFERSARTDMATLAVFRDFFREDVGRYPATEEGLDALLTEPVGTTDWRGPYTQRLRTDPWHRAYQYAQPGRNGSPFGLSSLGPDGVPSEDDIRWPVTAPGIGDIHGP